MSVKINWVEPTFDRVILGGTGCFEGEVDMRLASVWELTGLISGGNFLYKTIRK